MKLHHQVIAIAIATVLFTVVLPPILGEIEKVLNSYSKLIVYQVVIPV